MTVTTDRPLRVIQWTTGNIGRRSLHAIIGRSDMELVGVYAHSADKVGIDAAELAGWPLGSGKPTGITATNDIDALLAANQAAWHAIASKVTIADVGPGRSDAGQPSRVRFCGLAMPRFHV